ncbi:prepilin-type N-terminal cleavage/methylation domain-containing protein [Rhodopirellula sallentina]|uniref:Signal peptide protein n=1 Tax=Rhodopirellula sallentina SM41 TaxID=1263870 RepID=M5UG24_9BACT|nr:prepilin-type N-terminal cleavage/methylation domain-containing protein [Rhodopirellula sallentina]EMI54963.1 signal peptide protein [Rhodopirellula sallentina SM41]
MINKPNTTRPAKGIHSGFTLVEMLIAMAITLLMMAAVARAFAFVGASVRDSRGNLTLSSDLRDITTRLDDELRRCTVSLEPASGSGPDPAGYFLYAEGPCTDATSTLFGRNNSAISGDGSAVAEDSRYGDIDDYLAFTAVAPPGSWFTGKVPAYVLDSGVTDATPVVIRSKYAEIVYFTNPERDGTGNIVDADGNNLPDRLLLYRRVLLIRPDLNLRADGSILGMTPGSDWLTGMSNIHQLCDLSVRRSSNSDGTPNLSASARVIANSLSDLSKPHNRFAHVRVPWTTLAGGGGASTSMPILALEAPINLIASVTDGTETSTPPSYRPPYSDATTENVVTPANWSGYLRREFVLSGTRKGEDVIANNGRAFDVQIFDPNAAFYLSDANLVIGPNDAGYREVLFGSTGPDVPTLVPGGGFVDLAYPVLAGGSMRGWQARRIATLTSASTSPGNAAISEDLHTSSDNLNIQRLQSTFSGIEFGGTTFPTVASQQTYASSLLKSGRLVISDANEIVLFQPAFDTYTSSYERDGIYQARRYSGGIFRGTRWQVISTANSAFADWGADGIDSRPAGTFFPLLGNDDIAERETSAPFTTKPEAIRISVRLENTGTRQLRQASVVYRDNQ